MYKQISSTYRNQIGEYFYSISLICDYWKISDNSKVIIRIESERKFRWIVAKVFFDHSIKLQPLTRRLDNLM